MKTLDPVRSSCPGCGQHIECDAGWAGASLACPACGQAISVPGLPEQPATVRPAKNPRKTLKLALKPASLKH